MKEKIKKIKAEGQNPAPVQIIKEEEVIIAWEAPEYEYNPKDISWYWLSLIASIVLVAIALWQKNYLFAIFIAIAWLTLISIAGKHPTYWRFIIDLKGITIHHADKPEQSKKFYAFPDMQGFDIHDGFEDLKELVVKMKSKMNPYLKINFQKDDHDKIAALLSKFIPKEEYNESIVDSLAKLIRF